MARILAGEVLEEDEDGYETSHGSSDDLDSAATDDGEYDSNEVSDDNENEGRGESDLAAELWALKQTATVLEYAKQTDAYIRALDWPDSVAVEYFRNGLKPDIQDRLDQIPDLDATNYAGVKRAAHQIEQDAEEEIVETQTAQQVSKAKKSKKAFKLQLRDREDEACDELRALIPAKYLPIPGSDMLSLWHGALKYIAILTGRSIRSPLDNGSAITKAVTFEVKDAFARNILNVLIPAQYHPIPSPRKVVKVAEAAANYINNYLADGPKYELSGEQKEKYDKTQKEIKTREKRQEAKVSKKAKKQAQAGTQVKGKAKKAAPKAAAKAAKKAKSKASSTDTAPVKKALKRMQDELTKGASKKIKWENSGSVIVHAEQRAKEMTEALQQLKDTVMKDGN